MFTLKQVFKTMSFVLIALGSIIVVCESCIIANVVAASDTVVVAEQRIVHLFVGAGVFVVGLAIYYGADGVASLGK